jgi:hypothetical protein
MTEQPSHQIVRRPINSQPSAATPKPEQAAAAPQASPGVTGAPAGQPHSARQQDNASAPLEPGSPPQTAVNSGEPPKGPWTSEAKAGSKAGTPSVEAGPDVEAGETHRADRYLEAMVRDLPRAAGEDGRGDLALAREIHGIVNATNTFDRWREEDLLHLTREIERYRIQRVALPDASRFKALVTLLTPHMNVFNLEVHKTARDYICPEPNERKRAENYLRVLGITDAAINAQAAELHQRSIAALDRLIAPGSDPTQRNRAGGRTGHTPGCQG